ncbi:MAG: AMP-binding protein [Pseudomonadales bacterium]|nr:AMP-binding protein [Pseudomonadales bacterium]
MQADTLVELIETRARYDGDRMALIFPGRSISYRELGDEVERIAASLLTLGIHPGDRVGYFLPDGPDCLPLLFGIIRSGAIAVPLNNRFKAYELSLVISQCGLNVLFTTPQQDSSGSDYTGLIREAFPSLPTDVSGLLAGTSELPDLRYLINWSETPSALMSRQDFLRHGGDAPTTRVAIESADIAIVKYTSGTTGTPKGAMLSHRAILGAAKGTVEERFDLTSDDVLWSALPLFHIGGVAFAVACLWAGCPYVHTGFFDPDVAIDQFITHKVTVSLPAFETIWLPVVDHPRWQEVDQERLRIVTVVGTEQMLREIQSRHPQAPVLSCFGQTEACGYLSLVLPTDSLDVRVTTGGYPLPGMEAKITHAESGEILPAHSLGEICYRGPNAFDGYFREPELSASVWDEDGFFHTGDLGLMDEQGRITFRNRIKDMLKVGGENVAAAEVEDYIQQHPAVQIVQVVAAPDRRYVEVPAAFVELKAGATVSEEEIIDFCRGKIATFRVPRYVRFVSEWPMSGTKIKKFELRERISAELEDASITEAPKISSA